ncbi:uncharacterized protein [Temnothorax longispinosus]|uniref:uncharacterized protein isoform X5 n=1 Tax=Temnothorax longispinosus TaxID=300112 RepID=UPI003A99740F
MQGPQESAQEFMAALLKLSLHCKFGAYLQTELRNQFVFGLKNQRIQARLLETVNLTKESALKIACGMKMAEKGVNKLKEESPTEAAVDFIGAKSKQKKTKGQEKRNEVKGSQQGAKREPQQSNRSKFNNTSNHCNKRDKNNDVICFRCGQAHFATSCTLPRTVKCRECRGFGHLQKVCKKKGQTHMLEKVCSAMDREHLEHRAKFTVPLQIENRDVVFDVDCDSAVTLRVKIPVGEPEASESTSEESTSERSQSTERFQSPSTDSESREYSPICF